jgi:hypothetical protein
MLGLACWDYIAEGYQVPNTSVGIKDEMRRSLESTMTSNVDNNSSQVYHQ